MTQNNSDELKTNAEGKKYRVEKDGKFYGGDYPEEDASGDTGQM